MGLFNKADKASTEALSKRGESHLAPRTFNMTIGGLEKALLKEFPAEDAEKWDRTGLLVGERSLPVTRVAVALDATPGAVAAAAEAGANVLLTHHPAFLEAPDGFAPEASALESPGAVVWAAIRNQVALMDFHTALDVSPAAARVLPGMLGLKFTLRFAEPLEGSRRKGYGQICEVPDNDGEPEALARLAARCMAVFGRAPRVWGRGGRRRLRRDEVPHRAGAGGGARGRHRARPRCERAALGGRAGRGAGPRRCPCRGGDACRSVRELVDAGGRPRLVA